ncbi:MAG: NUDIX hydrolase [Deltaproteobacteria bacterium]|jgi:8-oxo-dGTP pyrophosphatase MutT (NUDIX family)|nr:NUDIX hydrolase [Deltaproteobacteria bacterium]
MTNLKPWVLTKQTGILKTPVFEVIHNFCLSPKDGLEKTFTCLRAPDWVNVIPITEDNQVILVNQFRHGTGELCLELPGGVNEPGQSPLDTAKRELMEETGYSAENFELLSSLRPNPALFANTMHTFVARPAKKTGQTSFDENEDIDLIMVPTDELKALITTGRIDHALMVAAIGLFLAKESLRPI